MYFAELEWFGDTIEKMIFYIYKNLVSFYEKENKLKAERGAELH